MDGEQRVLERAARQHGLLTRAEARAMGMSDDQVDQRLRSGRWAVERRGVLRVTGAPATEEQVVLAACLAAGPGAVASHLTAARLWRLRLPEPEIVEVTTPTDRRVRVAGVRQHRTERLVAADVHRLRAVPVTIPARTLLDCSAHVPPGDLAQAVDDALRRRLVALAELARCHRRVASGPGRRPAAAMRRLLEERGPGFDPGGSRRELEVRDVLVRAGLPAPVQQHRVRLGHRTFFLDLAYPGAMVGIEFDGWEAHGTFEAFHGDRERTRLLVATGWRMVPVTARTRPADLVRDVRRLLDARVASPLAAG